MRKKHKKITLSIPADLKSLLHAKFPNRGMSNYVAAFVKEALEKESATKMKALEAAYEEAENDPTRKKLIKEWAALEPDFRATA